MSSSKALLPRAATRTLFALLVVLDGAVAMRPPLPLATWHALEQGEWRIASAKHANSYLFRVDRGEAGGVGICTPATVGACCGDSATRAWYAASTGKAAPWIAAAGFKHADGRLLTTSLESWAHRETVLIPGKVSGAERTFRAHIDPALVAALPGDTWCVARWNPATRRLEPRPAAGGAACAAAACDLRRYTHGFDPKTDVLLTDQVGTALLLLADLTISKIGPEISSGACVRSGAPGEAAPSLSPSPSPSPSASATPTPTPTPTPSPSPPSTPTPTHPPTPKPTPPPLPFCVCYLVCLVPGGPEGIAPYVKVGLF